MSAGFQRNQAEAQVQMVRLGLLTVNSTSIAGAVLTCLIKI